MSAIGVIASTRSEGSTPEKFASFEGQRDSKATHEAKSPGESKDAARSQFGQVEEHVSAWSHSGLKRLFDISCVLLALPLLIPVYVVIGLAVRLTSRGPILFLQKRTGLHRRNFTILKFRTMKHLEDRARNHATITTAENQQFTPIGPILRRWKLDELPQLVNVLMGDMSLVGPRPKLPEHNLGELKCRPGITGAATIAFAREEHFLASLPHHRLDHCYHTIVLPAKLRLDREYMAQATFLTDLKLIVDTVARRWDSSQICTLLDGPSVEMQTNAPKAGHPATFTIARTIGGNHSG